MATHKIHHGLELELAQRVSRKAIDVYTKKYSEYNPNVVWTSPTTATLAFNFKGTSIKGTANIVGPDLVLDFDVPWIVRMFLGAAVKMIDEEVQVWVKIAKEGKLDQIQ